MKSIKLFLMAFITILSLSVFAQTKEVTKKAEADKCSCKKCGCAKGKCECTSKSCKCSSCSKEGAKIYACPMHHEITSDKPGKCSKCGMELKEQKEKTKSDAMKMYSCPMHHEVTSDKPGKCSKCGMALKAKS